jgi:hypothetical protein
LLQPDIASVDVDYGEIAERIRITDGANASINGSPQTFSVCNDAEHIINHGKRLVVKEPIILSPEVKLMPKAGLKRYKVNEILSEYLKDNPKAGIRIYQTRGGRKYIITHKPIHYSSEEFPKIHNALGNDEDYCALVQTQKNHASRISPKFNRIAHLGELEYCRMGAWIPFHKFKVTPKAFDMAKADISAGAEWFVDGPYQAWKTLMEWAAEKDVVMAKFVGQMGDICEEAKKFVDYHDHCCNSYGNGPIL